MGTWQLGSPAFPGYRPTAAVSISGVRSRLDMETDRLLFDDRAARLCRTTQEERVGDRYVEQWVTSGLDARLHMTQEDSWKRAKLNLAPKLGFRVWLPEPVKLHCAAVSGSWAK